MLLGEGSKEGPLFLQTKITGITFCYFIILCFKHAHPPPPPPSNIQDCVCCENYLKDNKQNCPHLTLKICSDICPWALSLTGSYQFSLSFTLGKLFVSENIIILFPDKYPSMFSHSMDAIFCMSRLIGLLIK